ncbi:di-heme oxidoredictase family protein [Cohaesibacter intestini]|uniref:di-heme oxidoreductase family protein n=1 Tax=Cohaesibacter intestini TaxID=2211145 RepID=UPI000DE80A7E|nr:di-heme oxidoredictase family protein [Cohaesibacter intestini]
MTRFLILAAAVCLAETAWADPLSPADRTVPAIYDAINDDPHLDLVPRTKAERARIRAVTAYPSDFSKPQPFERMSAGAATVEAKSDERAFAQPSGNMDFDKTLDFELGNSLFEKLWVSSPSSTKASDGLGPLYNARSCGRCHINDGRGHPPQSDEDSAVSMLLRVSVPAASHPLQDKIPGYHAYGPDPTYGYQLQDFSAVGHGAEFQLKVSYEEKKVALNGGETATLQMPTYQVTGLGYGPLHKGAMLSPRVAPAMIGLGLLEAIPAADILALADPDDRDEDGISGRPNRVWSVEHGRPMLGRFGLKAGMPTVRQQAADAFSGDIGISTPLFQNPWGDCTTHQARCRTAIHGDGDARHWEVDETGLDLVTFYSRNLAVPARRHVDDPEVLRGKMLFHQTGCVACHRPAFVTHRLADRAEQSFQLIWPYSDLLLHDMGDGLADNRPEAVANGREWRTPPLWGLGLSEQVTGKASYLHDGRARTLLEAVLWHGGEAQNQRDAVVAMEPDQRQDLIRFLTSL